MSFDICHSTDGFNKATGSTGPAGRVRGVVTGECWCKEELELLERHGHKTHARIRQILEAHGYHRSLEAVRKKRFHHVGGQKSLLESADLMTPADVGCALGIGVSIVRRWIRDGQLAAQKSMEVNGHAEHGAYIVSRKALRAFVVAHPHRLDGGADIVFIVDLLTGK